MKRRLGAGLEDKSIVERESGLHKALSKGQIVMISLGGAIGTTLFLSSGIALGYAGPSVLVSYAIAGLIAVAAVALGVAIATENPGAIATALGTLASSITSPAATSPPARWWRRVRVCSC